LNSLKNWPIFHPTVLYFNGTVGHNHAKNAVCSFFSLLPITDTVLLCRWYTPLFAHRREIVHSFAAESYAYLMRKMSIKALAKHMKELFSNMDKSDDANSLAETFGR